MEQLTKANQQGNDGMLILQDTAKIKASVLVCFSAINFGLMPVFARYAYRDGVNPLTFLSLRFLVAAIILTIVALIRGENLRLSPKQYLALAALGIGGYSAVAGLYFYAITKIPASITSLILYTYPVIVTLYSVFSGEEKIEYRKFLALVISCIGIVLILNAGLRGLNVIGIILASGTAIFYSLYIIFSNKILRTVSPLVATTFIIWSAAAALGTTALATGSMSLEFGITGWTAILGIALLSTVGGILAFQMGLGVVGPSQASILSTLEPLVTVVASCILFGEVLGFVQILGGGLILIASVLLQLPSKSRNSR